METSCWLWRRASYRQRCARSCSTTGQWCTCCLARFAPGQRLACSVGRRRSACPHRCSGELERRGGTHCSCLCTLLESQPYLTQVCIHPSIRYYFFEKWASLYSSRAMLLVTDFRGVIFQSDPFSYRRQEWFLDHQLAVFQEFHPSMVIGRCSFQRSVLLECFGNDALRLYINRVAISAGAFIGSRDGMLVWAHHMTMVSTCMCVFLEPLLRRTCLPSSSVCQVN